MGPLRPHPVHFAPEAAPQTVHVHFARAILPCPPPSPTVTVTVTVIGTMTAAAPAWQNLGLHSRPPRGGDPFRARPPRGPFHPPRGGTRTALEPLLEVDSSKDSPLDLAPTMNDFEERSGGGGFAMLDSPVVSGPLLPSPGPAVSSTNRPRPSDERSERAPTITELINVYPQDKSSSSKKGRTGTGAAAAAAAAVDGAHADLTINGSHANLKMTSRPVRGRSCPDLAGGIVDQAKRLYPKRRGAGAGRGRNGKKLRPLHEVLEDGENVHVRSQMHRKALANMVGSCGREICSGN